MGIEHKKTIIIFPLLLISIFTVLLYRPDGDVQRPVTGRVFDSVTKRPIKGAIVTLDDDVVITDESGTFAAKGKANRVAVRALGYLRAEQAIKAPLASVPLQIGLAPFKAKALYLSPYGIGSKVLQGAALKLIEETELNALVIDVKGDRGFVGYRSSVPLVSEAGGQKIRVIKDMKGLMQSLKEKGIYTIARIVVFKDNPLAQTHPELAVRTRSGGIWTDKEKLAWVDPFKKKVWDYNIDIAIEAAQYGFDEIQFDYVRFPDAEAPVFSMPNTEEGRVGAITGFLKEAKRRLAPYNVFLSADVFGYASWNLNDTKIGQKIEPLAQVVEYISLMLYPSGFQFGIPGYRNPVAHPHEIVYLSLKRARERTNLQPVSFRPWLQAFRDYAFDRRHFKGPEIRSQIDAAEKFGSNGWMLWNPRNDYHRDGLKAKNSETTTPDVPANKITVEKSKRKLSLWQDEHLLRTYRISLGGNPVGHKLELGDNRTPEGLYYIDAKNSKSRYHLSLRISYPNGKDEEATDKRGAFPGGDIYIHGLPDNSKAAAKRHLAKNWTKGCIAVTNKEIEEIWKLVRVGTPIEIMP